MQTIFPVAVSHQQRSLEGTMFSSKAIRQLAAYSVSLPTFAAPPALAKETVYMPSHLAALVLGRGPVAGVVIREPSPSAEHRESAA
jgi:hypothetical protein